MESASKSITPKTKPFFRSDPFASILLLTTVFVASQFLAAILTSLYPAIQSWTEAEGSTWLDSITGRFVFMLIAEALAIIAVVQLVRAARVRMQRIGLVVPRLRDVGWAFISYGLYFLVYLVVLGFVRALLPAIDINQEQKIGFENAYYSSELFMAFVILVIIVPIAEEFMFRGFLFSSLRAKYRFWPATIVTGLLFGIAHLQFGSSAPLLWIAAIDTFILSCFLCYIREQTGSIWGSVGLHAIKNGVAFIILFAPRLFF